MTGPRLPGRTLVRRASPRRIGGAPAALWREPTLRLLEAVCAASVMSAGCGGSDPQPQTEAPEATSSPTPAATATRTPETAAASDEPDPDAAVAAARDELPEIPLWEGTRFRATVTSADEVCVDRVLTKESAETVGGRRSHVVVSWPELDVGEPQDVPCAKAEETADAAIESSRRFYLRMDDDAIALDKAVAAAQDGAADGVQRIARVRKRIQNRLNRYLLDGGGTSVGANLLLSAATTAREAAERGDAARLADMRREIAGARTALAEEVMD